MTNMLIRDVPEDVHAKLVESAAARGLSLQQFLQRELATIAARSTLEVVVEGWREMAREIAERGDPRWPTVDSVELIAQGRRERDTHWDEMLGDRDKGQR